jgi:hypothetical protein
MTFRYKLVKSFNSPNEMPDIIPSGHFYHTTFLNAPVDVRMSPVDLDGKKFGEYYSDFESINGDIHLAMYSRKTNSHAFLKTIALVPAPGFNFLAGTYQVVNGLNLGLELDETYTLFLVSGQSGAGAFTSIGGLTNTDVALDTLGAGDDGNVLYWDNTANQWSHKPVTDGVNVGGQTGEIYAGKSGTDIQFKTISGSGGITITNNLDNIDIAGSGGTTLYRGRLYTYNSVFSTPNNGEITANVNTVRLSKFQTDGSPYTTSFTLGKGDSLSIYSQDDRGKVINDHLDKNITFTDLGSYIEIGNFFSSVSANFINGENLLVDFQEGGYREISQLEDVQLSKIVDTQVLAWNSATLKFNNVFRSEVDSLPLGNPMFYTASPTPLDGQFYYDLPTQLLAISQNDTLGNPKPIQTPNVGDEVYFHIRFQSQFYQHYRILTTPTVVGSYTTMTAVRLHSTSQSISSEYIYTLIQQSMDKVISNTDPAITDDITQNYLVGDLWLNTTDDSSWICVDNTLGNAVWNVVVIDGVNNGGGAEVYETNTNGKLHFRTITNTDGVIQITQNPNTVQLDINEAVATHFTGGIHMTYTNNPPTTDGEFRLNGASFEISKNSVGVTTSIVTQPLLQPLTNFFFYNSSHKDDPYGFVILDKTATLTDNTTYWGVSGATGNLSLLAQNDDIRMFVQIPNPSNIAQLTDVELGLTLLDQEILTYEDSTGKWINQALPTSSATTSGVIELATQAEVDAEVDATRALTTDTFIQSVRTRTLTELGTNTGLVDGGLLSVGTGGAGVATTFSISDGFGYVLDTSVVGQPVISKVTWTGLTDLTITNLATNLITFVCINSSGTVVQSTTRWQPEEYRDCMILGVVVHVNKTTVDTVNQEQAYALQSLNHVNDLFEVIKFANVAGNILSGNPAVLLNLQKSAGTMFGRGINYFNDVNRPNHLTMVATGTGAGDKSIFQYRLSDGTNATPLNPDTIAYGSLLNEYVDPTRYESVSGTLSTVPPNNWSTQRVYLFTSGNIKLQYGAAVYPTLEAAKSNLSTEAFLTEPSIEANGLLLGFIFIDEGCTDLTDVGNTVLFLQANKFGTAPAGGGAGGASDHGLLVGLADDDHTQYLLVDGTRAMTGDLNMSTHNVLVSTLPTIGDHLANKTYVDSVAGGGGGSVTSWEIIPFVMSNLLPTANSYVYYMNVRSTFTKTITTFEIQVGSGTDAYRCAIYTGSGTSAVLKAQTINNTGIGIGVQSFALVAEVGQDLDITTETDYVVALSIDGTSGRPLGFTGLSDTNIAWLNTTDVNVAGFPVNPQTQTATTIRFCCRIY